MRIILWDYMENAEEVMTKGALATMSNTVAPDLRVTEEQKHKMIRYSKKMKLSSILDFGYYIFSFEGVSRSFTHQWVRYRIAAHMQQSLRYVKINTERANWFVIPPSIIKKGYDSVVEYIKNQLAAGKTYLGLLERGIPAEDARFALPIGVRTHISSAFDSEEMIHIIYQRTCFDAQWEIRTAAYAVLLAGLIVHPLIFDGVGPACIMEGICRGRSKWKCKKDVERILEGLKKIAEEYRPKFNDLQRGMYLRIDLTDILGYRAPDTLKRKIYEDLGYQVGLDYEVILEVKKK
ncbi:MAG: FAD-dependent thymidylate synthase [Candidatus Njordarchaeota archaeon]